MDKFTSFLKPYLNFIDSGHFFRRPFGWLYALIAILNLLFPLLVLYGASDVFSAGAMMIISFILIWLVMALAGWFSFQIWWDRRNSLNSSSEEGDEFIATPVFSHFIQTLGEWAGTWIGVVGTWSALIVTIFLDSREGSAMLNQIGVGEFMSVGFAFVIIMPIYAFLIVVGSRFVAEQAKALASIANNTKRQ